MNFHTSRVLFLLSGTWMLPLACGGARAAEPAGDRVAHVEFSNLRIEADTAEFDEKLTWKNGGVRLLDELRHYRVRALGDGQYFLDFSFRLRATYGNVTNTRDVSHYAIPYIQIEIWNSNVRNTHKHVRHADAHARWTGRLVLFRISCFGFPGWIPVRRVGLSIEASPVLPGTSGRAAGYASLD